MILPSASPAGVLLTLATAAAYAVPAVAAQRLADRTARLALWAARLGPRRGLRVGLAWSGSLGHRNDSKRSLRLAQWLPHLPPGLEYHALQKDIRPTDAEFLAQSAIHHHSENLTDFNQTAALCDLMDLVISVDTSVAHLSCAIGHPTGVLLPYCPDWRWQLMRQDSPWYPSATEGPETQISPTSSFAHRSHVSGLTMATVSPGTNRPLATMD